MQDMLDNLKMENDQLNRRMILLGEQSEELLRTKTKLYETEE
jgi:hypothetical protein